MNTKFEVNNVVDYTFLSPRRSRIHFIKISKDGVFYEMTNGDVVSEDKLTLVEEENQSSGMRKPKFNMGDKVSYKVPNTKANNVLTEECTITSVKYLESIDDFVYNGFMEDELTLVEREQKLPKTYEEALNLVETVYYKSGKSYIAIDTKTELPISYACSVSGETALKHVAFEKLIFLRDIYRQGWKPDWENSTEYKYSIITTQGKVCVTIELFDSKVLSFQSAAIRDRFLENFKDLIEECKEFI